MEQTRRKLLLVTGTALASVSLAGCSGSTDDEQPEDGPENTEDDPEPADTPNQSEDGTAFEAVDIGVISEWNAIRSRLRDPVVLGHADAYESATGIVEEIFERFETASGEHNAHETLEETDESNYEGFESALSELGEALEAEDLESAHEAMQTADENLLSAQTTLTDDSIAESLTLLVVAAHVEDGLILLSRGAHQAAAQEFTRIGDRFADSDLRDAVVEVDQDAADAFQTAAYEASSAAEKEDVEAATESAHDAFEAAVQGLYALESEAVAGALHTAALQARGWDGAAVAAAGGPTQSYAHAAALNEYRARARDAMLLFENDAPDAAARTAQTALEGFETAQAHDALEEADHESYESFESGLETLLAAIDDGEASGVRDAVGTVDSALRSGIGALVTGGLPALLEASYARIRVADAVEQYRLGRRERAIKLVQNVLADFEVDLAGFHESLEETDRELYEAFEHEHLEGLLTAMENGDDEAVAPHVDGIHEALSDFEQQLTGTAAVSGAESGYMLGRVLDASALAALGESDRAETITNETLGYFERGAAGFHEALEAADHDRYEQFEAAIEAGPSSAEDAVSRAVDATYAVVAAGGGGGNAGSLVSDIFAHFEEATVHDLLEEADQESYETFERNLEAYIEGLDAGESPDEYAASYAESCLQAQFAVAGAPDEAPADPESENTEASEPDLEGGPNVVEGVPDEAGHVVDMQAVSFDPEEITIQRGESVAWRFAAGEPHNVVAYEDEIPDDAEYWASGGFDSESAARKGWENGQGAVQEGQSYVKTFETLGEHGYFCVPHETAGMVGTVVVEE